MHAALSSPLAGCLILSAVALSCASAQESRPSVLPGDPFTIAMNEKLGCPAASVIEIATQIIGRKVHASAAVTAGLAIKMPGVAKVERRIAPLFFQALLHRVGLDWVNRGSGAKRTVHIVRSSLTTNRVPPDPTAAFVSVAQLAKRKGEKQLFTVVRLKHRASRELVPILRARKFGKLRVGRLVEGEVMILQGPRPRVWAAYQHLRKIDRSSAEGAVPVAAKAKAKAKDNRPFSMVPTRGCVAAVFERRPYQAMGAILKQLSAATRKRIDDSLRAAGRFDGTEALLKHLSKSALIRVGVVLRPNQRSAAFVREFPAKGDKRSPQWAFVFSVAPDSDGGHKSVDFEEFVVMVNRNRRAFGIARGFKLAIRGKSAAFEFGIRDVAATGSISMIVHDGHFVISNAGPFIYEMMQAHHHAKGRPLIKAKPGVWMVDATLRKLLRSVERDSDDGKLRKGKLRKGKLRKGKLRKGKLRKGKLEAWANFAFGGS